ncbi:S8 family serine peptidase (plasmid) [Pseudoalteromonas lipolytica]|uniref:S8 family serine peptidase n=1 Tax=Pseudoalteromonas lipolytica TaxID=570156 RepID=UPI003BA1704E
MNYKIITTSVLGALYAAGVGAAAQGGLKPLPISADTVSQQTENKLRAKRDALHAKSNRSALNRHIKRKTVAEKFTPEAGISGVHTYIIQLRDQPIATYDGSIKGYKSTAIKAHDSRTLKSIGSGVHQPMTAAPANSQKLFVNSVPANDNIAAYQAFLHDQQDSFLDQAYAAGINLQVSRRFTASLNALAVTMTQKQALQLAKLTAVENIQRSIVHKLETDVGPQVIKADAAWNNTTVNPSYPMGLKGEGQIIGVIDTGINTDHVSFADIGSDGYDHTNPLGKGNYLGQCQEAEFAERCNDKLIGVYTWDVMAEMYTDPIFSEVRPYFGEDYNGHGSHTASTAAGNVVHDAPYQFPSYQLFESNPNMGAYGDGVDTGLTRNVSGVAPHANVIMYQACWNGDGQTSSYYGCPTTATLASIEQAVLDGVDVINYSISGSNFPWDGVIEQAFFSAYAAGISVAAAAGNGGSNSPTNHPSPWLMNVAATEHSRIFGAEPKLLNDLTGGDTPAPQGIDGATIGSGISGEIVLAKNYGNTYCDNPFPENTFTSDQIVACKRSNKPRMTKADHLVAAGAGGFILYNSSRSQDEATDLYPLPSIHIDYYEGYELEKWLSSGTGHRGTITAAEANVSFDESRNNKLAEFNSTKVNPHFDGTLSPNIAAPGVDILAAYADDQPFTSFPQAMDWNVISGTSMATPHIAGALALVRQAHPDWSVAEVQSALQSTAGNVLDSGNTYGDDRFFHGGSGLVNIEAAINAGFVMDETAENMLLANPRNGGDPADLNVPSLVDTSCETTCSWIRTIKATKDGSWKVSAQANHDEVSISFDVQPSEFSLKAGETQSVIVYATILDATTSWDNLEETYLWGDVKFTPQDSMTPEAHWPVKMKMDRNNIPKMLRATAHRNADKLSVKDIPVSKVTDFHARAYLADAEVVTAEFPHDNDFAGVYFDYDFTATKTHWISVPEGSKRLFAEALETVSTTSRNMWFAGDLDILIGRDLDGDKEIDFEEETICWSSAERAVKDFCSINNPDAGEYWIVFYNFENDFIEPGIHSDVHKYVYGIATGEQTTDVTVTTTSNIDVTATSLDLELNWNFDTFVEGEYKFGAIDLGTSQLDAANLGTIPFKIKRGQNDLSIYGSQDVARAGDVIDMKVSVLHNMLGYDREFAITTMLPKGTTLVDEPRVSNQRIDTEIKIESDHFIVSGVQADVSNKSRGYTITTNETDAMCRVPYTEDGKYLDIQNTYGFRPSLGGDWDQHWSFNFDDFWEIDNNDFALYHNQNEVPFNSVEVSAAGMLYFGEIWLLQGSSYSFEPSTLESMLGIIPDSMVAPLLRGDTFNGGTLTTRNGFEQGIYKGITVLYDNDPKVLIVDWRGATTEGFSFETWDWESFGDNYDMQTYVYMDYNHAAGHPEVIMAYDNLTFAEKQFYDWAVMDLDDGTVGVYGYHGQRGTYYPIEGMSGDMYTRGDISNTLKNGLVICYDYDGPEATAFDIEFQVKVNDTAVAQLLNIETNSDIEGIETVNAIHEINVPGNITLVDIDDMITNENRAVSGITVLYHDKDKVSNTISVEGKHVTAQIHGHESGAQFDLIPEENWYGETLVTVTVADNAFPNDAMSSTFMLTVSSDGLNNIEVMPMPDVVHEGHGVFDITVEYSDMQQDENIISVSGEHISADVKSHDSGAVVTIVPEQDWAGETVVTVVVTDSMNSADKASTRFVLSVDIAGCTDSAASNYNPVANKSDDSCTYPVAEDITEKVKKSSSGAMHFIMIFMGLLFLNRRRVR